MSAATIPTIPPMRHASPRVPTEALLLRCLRCQNLLGTVSETGRLGGRDSMACTACGFQIEYENGIWRALPAERQRHFAQFMREYETIRKSEGRGCPSAAFYIGLPFHDLSGHNTDQWKIRARSYRALERILSRSTSEKNQRSTILDLGAGNGWLSYRLARLGHHPVAVDLLTNDFDGLGATRHYRAVLPKLFPCFQAEMDCLPFEKAQFDCAIFNASFHYSENYLTTFGEAMRCVRPGGVVVILDSPWYAHQESGKQMVAERHRVFQSRYGFRSDGLTSRDYLTDHDLSELEAHFKVRFEIDRPWYGVRWSLRPALAKLKNKREPSRFRIYTAEVPSV